MKSNFGGDKMQKLKTELGWEEGMFDLSPRPSQMGRGLVA